MKIGIMQPYLFPYIGYFHLINAVDSFVVYDNIEYTKKGWINRNRILLNGTDTLFTIPIKKDSDFLDVRERFISEEFDQVKLLRMIQTSYQKAPYYDKTIKLVQDILRNEERNLFDFIYFSIVAITNYLEIKTKFIISSTVEIDHSLRGQDKVLAICKKMKADHYINAIGGKEIYSKDIFYENGINLNFVKSRVIEYKQFNNEFIPWLSIIDVLMFNDLENVKQMLKEYDEL